MLRCVLALFINAAIASAIGFGLANALDTVILHIFTAVLFVGFAIKMHLDSKDASAAGCESLDEAKDAVRDTNKKVIYICQNFETHKQKMSNIAKHVKSQVYFFIF